MRLKRWLAALSLGVLASGCAAVGAGQVAHVATPAAATARPTSAPDPALAPPLALVVGGVARPLRDGDDVPLNGELAARVRLRPGEGRFGRAVDLSLRRGRAASSLPVGDAKVSVQGEMREMQHGAFRGAGYPVADGHYLVPLPFAMPGEWRVGLQIDTHDQRSALLLEIVVPD
jgi:hypothetical protein